MSKLRLEPGWLGSTAGCLAAVPKSSFSVQHVAGPCTKVEYFSHCSPTIFPLMFALCFPGNIRYSVLLASVTTAALPLAFEQPQG